MTRTTKLGTIAACTAALWIFPSFGTQGMGTLRQTYGHVDRMLFTTPQSVSRSEAVLRNADRRLDAIIVQPAR